MAERDTILINIMYTGDYTNKNIGHEIINMYKTDNEDNYLYISPYGYVTNGWDNRIKTILYARSAGKDKLEIIAKAEIELEEQQKIKDMVERPKLKLDGNEKGFKTLKSEWKSLVKQLDDEYNQFIDELKRLESQARKEIMKNNQIDIQTLEKEYFPKYNEGLKDTYKNKDKYKKWIQENGDKIKGDLEKWENSYDDWKHNKQESKGYFVWLKENNEKHLQQIKEIYSNEIIYDDKYLCDIFEGNFWDESAIYYGYKVTDIKKPSTPIIIKYSEYKTENKGKKGNKYKATYIGRDEQQHTYLFKHAKIKNQSCSFYLNAERIDGFERFQQEFKEEFNKEINTLKKSSYQNIIDEYDKTLITIMRKQNDELSYSNMLAYYLNNKEIFKKFVKEVLLWNKEISLEKTFEIQREYKNIDLLINTDNDVFVIENKIKSGINGEKYDPYNGTYSNQLIKYYKTVVSEDEFFKRKEPHFYIFKPKYNEITIENLTKVKIKGIPEGDEEDSEKKETTNERSIRDDEINMIKKWMIRDYELIHKFFNEHREQLSENNSICATLVDQFIRALALHKDSCENIVEQEMEYKFRQAIKNARSNL